MSFGVSVGDIIGISKLAWKVFKACKESSADFKRLSGEVASLHLVLKEAEEVVAENDSDPNIRPEQGTQLKEIAVGCRGTLEEVEALLKKYQRLGSKSQRTWDRLKWGSEPVAGLRARLISNTSLLSAYNSTLVKYGPRLHD